MKSKNPHVAVSDAMKLIDMLKHDRIISGEEYLLLRDVITSYATLLRKGERRP